MTEIKKPEILAPVGGEQQMYAAVRCGADAVYFGMQNFNARRNAENFGANLKETIEYCHLHGVKVNITVNTVVTDPELKDMRMAVDEAARAGADALIIQDLAVAGYVRKHWPGIPMHASTQMAVHNSEGVKMLQEYGFSRIVLARELSLEEIKKIYSETGAELEVFVHGAHCMSVSGNCYMSSMIGARSGNRGLCAQPCRLDWAHADRDHALSLKDLSYIKHLDEIAEAGVCSVKIEGRMKRPEYVAAAVLACKGQTDDKTLKAVFSRSGFTDGYLTGKQDISMFGYRTKEDVLAAGDVLDDLAKLYEKEPQSLALNMFLYVQEGEPSQLTVTHRKHCVTVMGDEPQKARTMPLNKEYAERSLSKTGGTPFYLSGLELACGEGLMLPASALNDMRRRAVTGISAKIIEDNTPRYRRVDSRAEYLPEHHFPKNQEIRLRFENADQIFDCDEQLILPVRELTRHPGLIARGVWGEIPSLIWEGCIESVRAELTALKAIGLTDVVCENIGAVRLASELGLNVHCGAFLNITNTDSLNEYEKLGIADAVISFELSFALFRKLKGSTKMGYIGYGYLPLMKFRSCPGRGAKGCEGCTGMSVLTDRKDEDFVLMCRGKQYSELLNYVPLYVADKSLPPADFEVMYFTKESQGEAENIYRLYKARDRFDGERTSGLYYRELL